MSKNFNSQYTVDLNGVESLGDLKVAEAVGKLNASELTPTDLAEIFNRQILNSIDENNAEALVIYKNGDTEFITVDALNSMADILSDGITDMINEAVNVATKKKEPWYKRLWHKIFPKKNK